MRAINPVIQTPPRLNSDRFNADAGHTAAPAAERGFSDTLNSVGAKPARRNTANRGQNAHGGGDKLPAAGNSPPPPPPAPRSAPADAASSGSTGKPGAATATAPAGATAPATAPARDTAPEGSKEAPPRLPAANAAPSAAEAVGTPAASPGPVGELPQSPQNLAPPPVATAPSASAMLPLNGGAPVAKSATGDRQTPPLKPAATSAAVSTSSWVAGRNAAAMRAINLAGASDSASAGNVTDAGQVQHGVPVADASTEATGPGTQVDTAAMLVAVQGSSAILAAAPDAPRETSAAVIANPLASPLGPSAAVGEIPSALPATAAGAASAAQVVSTILAGVATDKKLHADSSDNPSGSAALSTADAAGAAQLLNAQSASHLNVNALPSFKVNAPVDSPEFAQNVANHVATLFDGNVNSAKLLVNPPALGPIEVRIAIQGDHAQVWMASHSAMTRDALQEAAPKLREMLNSQGFVQVSVDISQRSFQERSPMAHAYEWKRESSDASSPAVSSAPSVTSRAPSGTLDAYA